jgi:hypothetical protein
LVKYSSIVKLLRVLGLRFGASIDLGGLFHEEMRAVHRRPALPQLTNALAEAASSQWLD